MGCLAGGSHRLFDTKPMPSHISRSFFLAEGFKTSPTALAYNKNFAVSFSHASSAHNGSCIVDTTKHVDGIRGINASVSKDQVILPPSQQGDLGTVNPSQNVQVFTGNGDVNNGDGMAISSTSSTNPRKSSIAKLKHPGSSFQENGTASQGAKLPSNGNAGRDGVRSIENTETFSSPLAMNNPELMERVDQNSKGYTSSTGKLDMPTPSSSSDEAQSQISGHTKLPSLFDEHEVTFAHLLASKNIIEFISRFPAWADAQKESVMPQRQMRAFYSHDDWLRHRSSLRYVRHMLSSVSSRVIVSLVPPVFTFTAGAVGVAAYNTALDFSLLPSFFPLLHAASLPYELTAPALALLLVFRTDASYSRYDEARKTWTSVISTTKELARQSAQMIKRPQDSALKSSLLSYIMAFPVSLKCHLIHGSDTEGDLQALLQGDDLAFVLRSQHKPNCLIQLISQTLGHLHLETTDRALLEGHVTQYTASVSICERLIRTPIPLSYTRLTSRFLVLWHMTLPIVLWDSCNWLVVPATFFSATTLFCIEEVGVLIEEPFPMLALDKIIGVAHDNIWEWLKHQQQTDDFLASKIESYRQ